MKIPPESIFAKYLIKTHYLVRVLTFYPETQTVDVIQDTFEFTPSPIGNYIVTNEFDEEVVTVLTTPDIIRGIPVQQLRWGQFEIQCCPKKDDTGYIEVFVDDIQDWIENGSKSVPWSDSKFLKKNSVFVPFVPNHKNAVEDYPTLNDRLIIKSESAKVEIVEDNDGTKINAIADTIAFTGDLSVDGDITCTGDIKATGDVIAGTVSLKNHTHAVPGTGLSAPSGGGPVTGSATSNAPA